MTVMKNASQGKKKTVQQKSHPKHIKSCQDISRKIRSRHQRDHRPDLFLQSLPSQNRRKQKQSSYKDPAQRYDPKYQCFSRLSSSFHIFQPERGEGPVLRKRREICSSRPSPLSPVLWNLPPFLSDNPFFPVPDKEPSSEQSPIKGFLLTLPPFFLFSAFPYRCRSCRQLQSEKRSGFPGFRSQERLVSDPP